MSQILTLELSDEVYTALQQQANTVGISVAELVAGFVNRQYSLPASSQSYTESVLDKKAQGRRMAEILAKLAVRQVMTDVDPVIWQQQTRKERSLPVR